MVSYTDGRQTGSHYHEGQCVVGTEINLELDVSRECGDAPVLY